MNHLYSEAIFLCHHHPDTGLPTGRCDGVKVPALGLALSCPGVPCSRQAGAVKFGRVALLCRTGWPTPNWCWEGVALSRAGLVRLLHEAKRLGAVPEGPAVAEAESAWRGEVSWEVVLASLLPASGEAWERN